jgi:hypothetical protein
MKRNGCVYEDLLIADIFKIITASLHKVELQQNVYVQNLYY